MDPSLKNALDRRALLVLELEIIDHFIAAYHEFARLQPGAPLPAVQNLTLLSKADNATAGTESPIRPAPRPDNPKLDVLVPAVVDILRTTGRPMSRREIHEALTEKGLSVQGVDPRKTLGTLLWRAREYIDSIEGRGYWPKGDPVPPLSMDEPHARLLAERAARRAAGIPKRN